MHEEESHKLNPKQNQDKLYKKKNIVFDRDNGKNIQFIYKHYTCKEPNKAFSIDDYKFDSDKLYDIGTFPRGILTIINVEEFTNAISDEEKRVGTRKDAKELCNLFLKLGFNVHRLDNPNLKDVTDILKKTANEDVSKMSCYVVAVLTHGEQGKIRCCDKLLNINDIIKEICAPPLAEKPKLLLVQACRGSTFMPSLSSDKLKNISKKGNLLDLPAESNLLCAYATVDDYVSFRSDDGSWFIQAIVSNFKKYALKMDVVRILTRVNGDISLKKSKSVCNENKNSKQVGCIVSRLRKELFLPPLYGPL
ncbi:caspase-3 isoform X2 [Hydra vulgaris]|nr:caspase-3-like isoform X2 [Hydra vulgaris]XP_047134611.1 caspase-3-like isoform X2 [Hydra vulgaris]